MEWTSMLVTMQVITFDGYVPRALLEQAWIAVYIILRKREDVIVYIVPLIAYDPNVVLPGRLELELQ